MLFFKVILKMRYFIWFIECLLMIVLVLVITKLSLTKYLWMQGKGQLKIIVDAQPIEEAMKDGRFSDSDKLALQLIQDIKRFSVDSLGYKAISNYNTVYFQNHKPALWITTACQPFKFEAYQWQFPYLGKVAYKGFFEKPRAEKELKWLESQGFDADIGTVSAWSTLGWFPEPILSNWLKRDKANLANLIFHELFHGTIYVKNQVDLNENLASFIADKATMYYFKKDATVLKSYQNSKKDETLLTEFVLKFKERLAETYQLWENEALTIKLRTIKKDSLLNIFVAESAYLDLNDKKYLKRYLEKSYKAKNAFFMHYERYDSKYDSLNKVFNEKFQGNLLSYIKYLKKNNQSL
jgi:predicted aminopeptidase